MKEHFQKLEGDMSYGSAEFQHCKQANDQSVVDYYNELNMHARRAYPSVSQEVFNHLLLEKFQKGLLPPIKRVVVAKECKDPEAAFTQACKVENQRAFLMDEEKPESINLVDAKGGSSGRIDELNRKF